MWPEGCRFRPHAELSWLDEVWETRWCGWEWPGVCCHWTGMHWNGHFCRSTGRLEEIEDVMEVVEGTEGPVESHGVAQGQAEGDRCDERKEVPESISPVNVREPASVNTTCFNPPTAEFCPRPRVLMSYGREVQRNIWLHAMVKRLCMLKFNGHYGIWCWSLLALEWIPIFTS